MLLDDPRFESILKRFRGRADLACRVLDAFARQSEQDIVNLAKAIEARDHEQISQIAHRIKGASANAGVENMRLYAEQIETLVRNGEPTDLSNQMRLLSEAWSEFRIALEEVGV